MMFAWGKRPSGKPGRMYGVLFGRERDRFIGVIISPPAVVPIDPRLREEAKEADQ